MRRVVSWWSVVPSNHARPVPHLLSLHEWSYGLDALRRAGLRAGRFYRAVWDLEHRGVVESRWEPASTDPRRRMYRLAIPDSVKETQQP